jgi:DNA-binding response OmpR family regulator
MEVTATPATSGSCRVLVAHSDESLCTTVGEILARDGFTFQICHNGHEALRAMEAAPPQVALLDVALPGLFAFELVDKVRNRPALSEVKILLLSSVYNKMAYKRTPTSLYGADDYIEKHHISDDLIPKINCLITHARPLKKRQAPLSEEEVAGKLVGPQEAAAENKQYFEEINMLIRSAEEREMLADTLSDAEEKARHLARNIVSDIALYNQERVEEGIRTGRFYELLEGEIAEGRLLFAERVGSTVHSQEDFLQTAFAALIERRRKELQL